MYYFALAENNYLTVIEDEIIILSLQSNTYISLKNESLLYLKIILLNKFDFKDNKYYLMKEKNNKSYSYKYDNLDNWINIFLKHNIIRISSFNNKFNLYPTYIDKLSEYNWNKYNNISSFKYLKPSLILYAIYILFLIYITMKISKIKGIHNLLNKKSKSKNNIGKPQISIDEIIKNLNFACIGVPFKVLCLEWATAFSILASHNGYKCKFCIGVQNKPFCAHAWVEFKNKVINDYPDLKKSLSIIYSKEL